MCIESFVAVAAVGLDWDRPVQWSMACWDRCQLERAALAVELDRERTVRRTFEAVLAEWKWVDRLKDRVRVKRDLATCKRGFTAVDNDSTLRAEQLLCFFRGEKYGMFHAVFIDDIGGDRAKLLLLLLLLLHGILQSLVVALNGFLAGDIRRRFIDHHAHVVVVLLSLATCIGSHSDIGCCG